MSELTTEKGMEHRIAFYNPSETVKGKLQSAIEKLSIAFFRQGVLKESQKLEAVAQVQDYESIQQIYKTLQDITFYDKSDTASLHLTMALSFLRQAIDGLRQDHTMSDERRRQREQETLSNLNTALEEAGAAAKQMY